MPPNRVYVRLGPRSLTVLFFLSLVVVVYGNVHPPTRQSPRGSGWLANRLEPLLYKAFSVSRTIYRPGLNPDKAPRFWNGTPGIFHRFGSGQQTKGPRELGRISKQSGPAGIARFYPHPRLRNPEPVGRGVAVYQ